MTIASCFRIQIGALPLSVDEPYRGLRAETVTLYM
jgi:hypothetical protein